jgi:putative ABC transport system substrate-binding protein
MRRREFITLVGGAAAWPLAAKAHQPAMPVIGFLAGPTAKGRASLIAAFQKGLTELGYSDGRNIVIESRWAEGQFDRLPAMANDLVQRKVAVLVVLPRLPDLRRRRRRPPFPSFSLRATRSERV